MTTIVGKKILFVITKSNWGGAQTYVFRLAKSMREAEADVAVALGGTGLPGAEAGMLEKKLGAESIRTIFLKSFARDISVLREFYAFGELMRAIQKERPHVLHVNSSKAAGLGALAGRLVGVPRIVFTAHGFPHREPRPLFVRILIWIFSWLTISLSHKVIAVSSSDWHHAPVFFSRKKIDLVRNGISSFELVDRERARVGLRGYAPDLPQEGVWLLINAELHQN